MGVSLPRFIPLAVIITCLSGLVYVAAQQNYRMTANDPQIQIANDLATSISRNGYQSLNPTGAIDLGSSLSPFVIVYDKNGKVVLSTGQLQGKTPSLPSGVLESTKQNGEDRITWQPAPNVRFAAVIRHYSDGTNSGYVLVARSLREVEIREEELKFMVGVAWIVTLVLTYASLLFFPLSKSKR